MAKMPSNAFLAPLKGEIPLSAAWWIYGLVVNVVAIVLFTVLRAVTGPDSLLPFLVILPLSIYWAVGIWQCAYNCGSRALGTYIRACVVAGFLGIAFFAVAALSGKWIVAT